MIKFDVPNMDVFVKVRMSSDDKVLLEYIAKKYNMSVSAFIRSLLQPCFARFYEQYAFDVYLSKGGD